MELQETYAGSFERALERARKADNKRQKGYHFEKLIQKFFQEDPQYKILFQKVELYHQWEKREGADCGIDLVAEKDDGSYCAIQCKFYDPQHTIQKNDLDGFITASDREIFTQRIFVSTTTKWSAIAEKQLKKIDTTTCTKIGIHNLKNSPIDWMPTSTLSIKENKSLKKRFVHTKKKLSTMS